MENAGKQNEVRKTAHNQSVSVFTNNVHFFQSFSHAYLNTLFSNWSLITLHTTVFSIFSLVSEKSTAFHIFQYLFLLLFVPMEFDYVGTLIYYLFLLVYYLINSLLLGI